MLPARFASSLLDTEESPVKGKKNNVSERNAVIVFYLDPVVQSKCRYRLQPICDFLISNLDTIGNVYITLRM